MKSSLAAALTVACVFAFTLALSAQDKPAPKEHTMTGCVRAGTEAGKFIVENTAEKGPKTIGILESKDNLKPHVGHKIDITGVAVPNKEAESMTPAPQKADHYMRLSGIKMVAAACP
jgi:hypothetical protein